MVEVRARWGVGNVSLTSPMLNSSTMMTYGFQHLCYSDVASTGPTTTAAEEHPYVFGSIEESSR